MHQGIKSWISWAVEERKRLIRERESWSEFQGREGAEIPALYPGFSCLSIYLQLLSVFKITAPTESAGKEWEKKGEESPAPVSLHSSFQTCGGSHSVWHLRSLPCWSAKSSENIAERKKKGQRKVEKTINQHLSRLWKTNGKDKLQDVFQHISIS